MPYYSTTTQQSEINRLAGLNGLKTENLCFNASHARTTKVTELYRPQAKLLLTWLNQQPGSKAPAPPHADYDQVTDEQFFNH